MCVSEQNRPQQFFRRKTRLYRQVVPLLLATGVVMAIPGCDIPDRPNINRTTTLRSMEAQVDEEFELPQTRWDGEWEAWFAYMRDGKPVGYSHMAATLGTEHADEAIVSIPEPARIELDRVAKRTSSIWYDIEDVIRFDRGNAVFLQTLQQVTRESTNGQFLGFWNRLRVGPASSQSVGTVEDSQLMIETYRGQKRASKSMPWGDSDRGVFAVLQSLRNKPMTAGEVRQLKHLSPIKHDVVSIRLSAIAKTAVPWIDGTSKLLLEISQQTSVGDQLQSESVIWVDDDGDIQRSFTPAPLNLVTYRVSKPQLTKLLDDNAELRTAVKDSSLKLQPNAWVQVDGQEIRDPSAVKRVGFEIIEKTDTLGDLSDRRRIPAAPDQYIKRKADGKVQLLVSRKPEVIASGFESFDQTTNPNDLKPTPLLNFTSKSVRDVGLGALRGLSLTPSETVKELSRTVVNLMERNADLGEFHSASDIVLASRGGAVEASVLLAAVLRSQKVPSRLALGLVYDNIEKPRLKFSAWTLAFVDERWISIDAVTGQLAPADRIILQITDTTTPIDETQFTSLLQQMQQLVVRVVAAKT